MRLSPRTHQHVTRVNTPGIIPTEPTHPLDQTLTQPSEGVIIPVSEGKRANTH